MSHGGHGNDAPGAGMWKDHFPTLPSFTVLALTSLSAWNTACLAWRKAISIPTELHPFSHSPHSSTEKPYSPCCPPCFKPFSRFSVDFKVKPKAPDKADRMHTVNATWPLLLSPTSTKCREPYALPIQYWESLTVSQSIAHPVPCFIVHLDNPIHLSRT